MENGQGIVENGKWKIWCTKFSIFHFQLSTIYAALKIVNLERFNFSRA